MILTDTIKFVKQTITMVALLYSLQACNSNNENFNSIKIKNGVNGYKKVEIVYDSCNVKMDDSTFKKVNNYLNENMVSLPRQLKIKITDYNTFKIVKCNDFLMVVNKDTCKTVTTKLINFYHDYLDYTKKCDNVDIIKLVKEIKYNEIIKFNDSTFTLSNKNTYLIPKIYKEHYENEYDTNFNKTITNSDISISIKIYEYTLNYLNN